MFFNSFFRYFLYLTGTKFILAPPSIGIIICKSKDKTYVEYALKNINAPIGVATYQLRNTLPEEMKAMLPEPKEIVKRLRIFEET